MASAAQILANQANSKLSTGPKSPEGKARSAANSTKDGLTAAYPVVDPSQSAAFDEYREALLLDTQPEGAIELDLFFSILTAGWNLRRARQLEISLLESTSLDEDDQHLARLARIARYRRDLERSYQRALNQLRSLQTQRAILLQRPAKTIDAIARIAPLAVLGAITTEQAPFLYSDHYDAGLCATFYESRNEASRAAEINRDRRRRAVPPTPEEIQAVRDGYPTSAQALAAA
ncbi:MAG: hypothetical protein HY821_01565 [Acidobacteria bacterium]|nr:hypothetical protein [Acidobacteriota bacterium]